MFTFTLSQKMPRLLNSRKARFTAALARCGMTQGQWLEKHGGQRSRTHLWLTLKNEKHSLKFTAEIDAFIREVEGKMSSAA